MIEKGRYWVGVLYPENMKPEWQQDIGDILQVPYAYCLHNADQDSKSEHRKDHVHLILAFPNTTTYKHAMSVFRELEQPGRAALNTCQAVIGIRSMYDYLIHDTETCRQKGKELYSPDQRITGNNFDIGAYEQVSVVEKKAMLRELADAIVQHGFTNFTDAYCYVITNFEDQAYFDVMTSYSGFLSQLTKGNYLKEEALKTAILKAKEDRS